jgi:hypothetical protein
VDGVGAEQYAWGTARPFTRTVPAVLVRLFALQAANAHVFPIATQAAWVVWMPSLQGVDIHVPPIAVHWAEAVGPGIVQ